MAHPHHRLQLFRRIGGALAALLVSTAGLVGCSKTAPQENPPSQASSAAAAATTTTSKAPEIPRSVALPASGSVYRAAATLYTDCAAQDQDGKLSFSGEPAQIFNPKTGRFVPMRTPVIPQGQDLKESYCTVGGDLDHIRIFHIITTLVPSSGLTPETWTSSLVILDPYSDAPPQIVSLPAVMNDDNNPTLHATKFGLTLQYHPAAEKNGYADQYVGFDAVTGEQSFTLTISGPRLLNDAALISDPRGWGVTGDAVIYSLKDGQDLAHFPAQVNGAVHGTYPNGFIITTSQTKAQNPEFGFFDTDDNQLKAPFPSTGDVFGTKFLALEKDSVEVRDLTNNAVLFRREGPDFEALHVDNAYIAGNYLYLKNDSDSPVIDINTSQKVSSGWKVRPTDFINRDWMITTTDPAGPGSCFKDDNVHCDTGSAPLVYAPNGKYDGPWY